MRDYARLCDRTKKYAQRANACAAPFYAQHARAHAQNYAPTALVNCRPALPTRARQHITYSAGWYFELVRTAAIVSISVRHRPTRPPTTSAAPNVN